MTKERKKIITYLVVVIMLFGTGFGLGYYLWGVDREQKPDYKKYLSKTIDYIANIEKDNQGFIKQIKGLKSEVAVINKDVKNAQSRSDAQSKSLQTRIASLEKEKSRLQSLLDKNQDLAKENKQLQTKIDSLLDKNQDLAKENKQLQTKIDSLFCCNQDLIKEKEQLQTKIDQLINELNTVKQKIVEVQSPVSKEKEPGEQEIQSPVSKEKEPGEQEIQSPVSKEKEPGEQEIESPVSKEKGPGEQEIESPVSKEKGRLEEKGHQSKRLPD
ncbi:MAG: hypothetical protein U9R02_03430 [Thermodesulfobacteriota bacterium]|nr:hypothetical protein [Thermodesulfobacteriota bacterium]